MTNLRKLSQEIEELTTKLLQIKDLQSPEAQKIGKQIKRRIKKLEDAGA